MHPYSQWSACLLPFPAHIARQTLYRGTIPALEACFRESAQHIEVSPPVGALPGLRTKGEEEGCSAAVWASARPWIGSASQTLERCCFRVVLLLYCHS